VLEGTKESCDTLEDETGNWDEAADLLERGIDDCYVCTLAQVILVASDFHRKQDMLRVKCAQLSQSFQNKVNMRRVERREVVYRTRGVERREV
jgi:hypothetical protein